MRLKDAGIIESFPTCGTSIRSLLRMYIVMSFSTGKVSECSVAELTRIRSVSGVNANVSRQFKLIDKGLLADTEIGEWGL